LKKVKVPEEWRKRRFFWKNRRPFRVIRGGLVVGGKEMDLMDTMDTMEKGETPPVHFVH
ncbi:hypothetical protein HMPREF3038_01025, partial [Akkermansia sp. KLE1797]